MKIRKWFVSNSSSSSFYCAICGGQSEMYGDNSPLYHDMYSCKGHHVFDIDCLPEGMRITIEEHAKARGFSLEEIPVDECPICTLQIIPRNDLFKYIKDTANMDAYESEIRKRFKNAKELHEFLWWRE